MAHEVAFSVGAVARHLGVAPSTLRTWNRRYGIGARELSPGRHRRYTAADIIRLEHMQRLILRGAAPADAARAALALGIAAAAPPNEAPSAPAEQILVTTVPASAPAVRAGQGHGSGGQRLALPGASPAARGLARGALALDETLLTETISLALAREGVAETWHTLVLPVFAAIGTRYERTGACIDAEHLLSSVIIATFSAVPVVSRLDEAGPPGAWPGGAGPRAVLLASAEGERHSLPLYALAAALAERGISTKNLGADLPRRSLADAIRRTGPGAVFIWSQLPATGDLAALPALPQRRPGNRLLLGGPGWCRGRPPAGVRQVHSLPDAVTEVVAALGEN